MTEEPLKSSVLTNSENNDPVVNSSNDDDVGSGNDSYFDSDSQTDTTDTDTDTDSDSDSDNLREMLDSIIKQYSELKRTTIAQKEDMERKIRDLTNRLADAQSTNEKRKEMLLSSTNNMKKLIEEINKMKNDKEDLITQIEEERKSHAETIKQLHTMQGQVLGKSNGPSEVEMTFRVLLDGSKVSEAILVKNVDSEKDDLRMQQSLLEKKLLSLNQDIVLLKQERDSNKESIKKNKALEKETEQLKARLKETEDSLNKSKKENDVLRKRGSSISIKSESSEGNVLKSESESLFKIIQSTESTEQLIDSLEDVGELIRDHFFHRSMFHSVQKKCIEVLSPTLENAGITTYQDVEKMYSTSASHSLFMNNLTDNMKPYDYVLNEIFVFLQKFKKSDIKEHKGADESQPSTRSSMTRVIRRGSDFTSVGAMLAPSSNAKSVGKDNSSYSELQDVQDFIQNVNNDQHSTTTTETSERKDELNTITHIFDVNGTIWTSSKAEGNKSELKTYESFGLGVIEQTTLPSRITAICNVGNYVFCGSEAGTLYIYNGRIMEEVKCDYCVQSSIVEIGSKGFDKQIAWIISDQSEFAIIEIGKKMKFKLSRLKIPSMVTCACVYGKHMYVGTICGVFKGEFPPSSKAKFTIFKEAPQFAVSSITTLKDTLWIGYNTKDTVVVIQKGKQPKTIIMKKINTLTPFLNDMWCCCGDGGIKAIDVTTLKVTNIKNVGSGIETRGGCILNIENISQQISNYTFFYGINDGVKKLVTDYYRHSFNKNTIEGPCSKCKKAVHKGSGLMCTYCSIFLHLECANLTKLEKICSRDLEKLNKQGMPRSSVVRGAQSTNVNVSPSPTKLNDSLSEN
ncbi:Phorbol-ester/DAG-type domain-containing protein [Entamoeba marina]